MDIKALHHILSTLYYTQPSVFMGFFVKFRHFSEKYNVVASDCRTFVVRKNFTIIKEMRYRETSEIEEKNTLTQYTYTHTHTQAILKKAEEMRRTKKNRISHQSHR